MKDKSYSDFIEPHEPNDIDLKQKLLNCNPLPEVAHNLAKLDMTAERSTSVVHIMEKTSSSLTETSTSSISSSLSTSSSANSNTIIATTIDCAEIQVELTETQQTVELNKTIELDESKSKPSDLNETEIKVNRRGLMIVFV